MKKLSRKEAEKARVLRAQKSNNFKLYNENHISLEELKTRSHFIDGQLDILKGIKISKKS